MTIPRVHYAERAVLHAADLSDEQAYRLALRRHHNDAGHRWGIVFGLALVAGTEGFTVQPGMAIDGFGRELVLARPLDRAWTSWDEQKQRDVFAVMGVESVAVWLLYDRLPDSPPVPGRVERGPGQSTRWIEAPFLRLLPFDENVDPRVPDIPAEDAAFSPEDEPPDEPEREWPVYLGRLDRDSTGYHYVPDRRPYVRLVGEDTTAVSGKARMQLADDANRTCFSVTLPDTSGALTDDRLCITSAGDMDVWGQTNLLADLERTKPGNFVLARREALTEQDIANVEVLVDNLIARSNPISRALWEGLPLDLQRELVDLRGSVPPALKSKLVGGLNKAVTQVTLPAPRIAVPGPGIPGRTVTRRAYRMFAAVPKVDQSVNVKRMVMQDTFPGAFASSNPDNNIWSAEFQPLAAVPAAAAPWQVYHVVTPRDGQDIHQLRIELAHPGDKGNPMLYSLQIGHHEPPAAGITTPTPVDQWTSCLTVLADGTVIIPRGAAVEVQGEVLEGPIQADPNDPRFGAAILGDGALGVAASEALKIKLTLVDSAGNAITSIAQGTTFRCKFEVTNASKAILVGGPIYYIMTIAGVVKSQGTAGSRFELQSQDPNPYTATTDLVPDAAGALAVSALVMAVSSGGQVVQGRTQAQLTVT